MGRVKIELLFLTNKQLHNASILHAMNSLKIIVFFLHFYQTNNVEIDQRSHFTNE